MNDPIAITGATGFVGRRLTRELLRRGRRVRTLVRDPGTADDLRRLGARLIAGDLHDSAALARLMRGCSGVVHCAGLVAARSDGEFHRVNAEGSRLTAQAAMTGQVPRFVQVSSLAAREPHLSGYGASKRAGEQAALDTLPPDRLTVIRPPAVYGPGDKATLPLIAQLTRRAGMVPVHARQRVSLIYVEDLAEALAEAVLGPAGGSEPIEIDDGRDGGYDWPELSRIAGEALGRRTGLWLLPRPVAASAATAMTAFSRLNGTVPLLTAGKVAELYHRDWVAHRRPAPALAGWQPRHGFAAGFRRTVQWYADNGWLPASTAPATTAPADEPEELPS